ncbi:chemotaxis protein CheB [Massilia antarctica]|uniref:chemotaxis protein CheB n=1 Tax=Massilia antarctica TaxID=2765360 RepID=UPI0006BB859B|nr:chemotaxis protein CheB [Massilia sp. H27-R4]MCY0915872.1 chemotaxis protein CheB [Massilia sp. H27-R4]CUI07346.1 Protein-glutamate methylesterase [Janthinobacterium sp. CG23_2]CUU31132.1 Protein-glutamate methylesterase [Janthinobacterium sp. CG23_2]
MTAVHDALLAGRKIDAVVIGASAGGIDALLRILPVLPRHFGFSVIVVLHLPDDRDSRLAEVFQQRLAMPVRQADDKMPLEAGTVYFAPPGYHLSIERDFSFSLSQEDPVHFSRPAIDVLMESAADAYGKRLAGILLTGASADGASGMARIAACGGLTVVQDPLDAEIATMPLAAIRLRAPDAVLSVPAISALMAAMKEIQ